MHCSRFTSFGTLLASFTLVNSLSKPNLSPRFHALHEIAMSQDGCEISCFVERNQHTVCYMECPPDSNQAGFEPTRETMSRLRARANGVGNDCTSTETLYAPCETKPFYLTLSEVPADWSGLPTVTVDRQNTQSLQARATSDVPELPPGGNVIQIINTCLSKTISLQARATDTEIEPACSLVYACGTQTHSLVPRAHTTRHANITAHTAVTSTVTLTETVTTIPDYCLTAVHFSPIPIIPTATLTQASSLFAAASLAQESATATTAPKNTSSISVITPAPVPIIPAPKVIGTAASVQAGIPQNANSTLPTLNKPTLTPTAGGGAAAPIQPVRGAAVNFNVREIGISVAIAMIIAWIVWLYVLMPVGNALTEPEHSGQAYESGWPWMKRPEF